MSRDAHLEDEPTTHGVESSRSLVTETHPWIFAGRYEIRALLGMGGMGSVYEALDRELLDVVALKIVRSELLALADTVERFRDEVRLARKITHRNVVRVYDLGEAEGRRFLTMERIEGVSLGSEIEERGPLPIPALLRVARDLVDGLAAAHEAGVIHRDLKPDNVVIAPSGRAVITDFGIARPLALAAGLLTLEGVGTPAYMAPELFGDAPAPDERSDVFALGSLLFEAATGELPWGGQTLGAIIEARLSTDARDVQTLRPDLPGTLASIIQGCIAREPGARPAGTAELAQALALVNVSPALPASPRVSSLGVDSARTRSGAWRADRVPTALQARSHSATKGVAVLPFRPASSEDDYLADGLTDAVIASLATVEILRVRPRGMVSRFRDGTASRAVAARELDAQVIVEGTLSRSGAIVSVAARAFAVHEDFPIWSLRVSCDVGDLFTLGDAVAAGLAVALACDRGSVVARPPIDPRVADLVLQAKYAYHSFWSSGAARALELFERAAAIAPLDPAVLAGASLAALRASLYHEEGLTRARQFIDRASAAALDHPEVRLARASLSLQENDPVSAVADLRRAIAAAPGLGEAHALLGRILIEADMVELAIKNLRWAIAIEPAQELARRDLCRAHALLGQWQELDAAQAEEGVSDDGAWIDRARTALWRRDVQSARDHLTRLVPRLGTDERGPMALARVVFDLIVNGNSPQGTPQYLSLAQHARSSRRRSSFVAQIDAEIAAFEGREADALEAIVRATGSGLTDLAWLERCPLFSSLREAPVMMAARRDAGAVAARVREALFDE